MQQETCLFKGAKDQCPSIVTFGKPDSAALLNALTKQQSEHHFWRNRLLTACAAGTLTRDDFRTFFSQYLLYSKNFTRLLAGLMASCENDYFRSRLSENLWDEGGGCQPDRRHSEIFRRFLVDALGVNLDEIQYEPFTKLFVHRFLDFCRQAPAHAASAFLALGTEGIVPRLYGIFCDGLLKAGLQEKELEFFRIHMECDDEHAHTLTEMMNSYAGQRAWFTDCEAAIGYALELRHEFFENVYNFILAKRVEPMLERARAGAASWPHDAQSHCLKADDPSSADLTTPLYHNSKEDENISFLVRRVNFPGEALDTRKVEIPPFRTNESHRHAHESLLIVLEGRAEILVNEKVIHAKSGDMVFVPRWASHQTRNTGAETLKMIAVTDYNLTRRLFLDDSAQTPRYAAKNDKDYVNSVAHRA